MDRWIDQSLVDKAKDAQLAMDTLLAIRANLQRIASEHPEIGNEIRENAQAITSIFGMVAPIVNFVANAPKGTR